MYFVYILQSKKNKSLYIGFTKNLPRRLKKHNNGESSATKPYRPYKLIYYEAFLNTKDARSREIFLKSGWGRRSINKILKFQFKNTNLENSNN
jgi:putative endonuclease